MEDLQGLLPDGLREFGVPDLLGQTQKGGAVHLLIAADQGVHLLALEGPAAAGQGSPQLGADRLVHRQAADGRIQLRQVSELRAGDPVHPGGDIHRSGLHRDRLRRRHVDPGLLRLGRQILHRNVQLRHLNRCGGKRGFGGRGLRFRGCRAEIADGLLPGQLLQPVDQRGNAGVRQGQIQLLGRDLPAAHQTGHAVGDGIAGQAVFPGTEPVVAAGQPGLLLGSQLPALGGQQEQQGRLGADRIDLRPVKAQLPQLAQEPGHAGTQARQPVRLGQHKNGCGAPGPGLGGHLGHQVLLGAVLQTFRVHKTQAHVLGQAKGIRQELQKHGFSCAGKGIDGSRKRCVHGVSSYLILQRRTGCARSFIRVSAAPAALDPGSRRRSGSFHRPPCRAWPRRASLPAGPGTGPRARSGPG